MMVQHLGGEPVKPRDTLMGSSPVFPIAVDYDESGCSKIPDVFLTVTETLMEMWMWTDRTLPCSRQILEGTE